MRFFLKQLFYAVILIKVYCLVQNFKYCKTLIDKDIVKWYLNIVDINQWKQFFLAAHIFSTNIRTVS